VKVEIYSDIACPWCYIGKARFERALTAFPGAGEVEVSYRPYQLDPNAPSKAVSLYEYTDRRFGPGMRPKHEQVSTMAARDGLDFHLDQALAVNTFTAHRLLWLAEHEYGTGVQAQLKTALLAAYFSHGRDVSDLATLVELAGGVGMATERVREFLTGDEGVAEVRGELADAVALGVSAVPTFVFEGKYAVQGAQEASTFLQVLEQVAAESTQVEPGTSAAGEACADGACEV
jgi:predicted DsbA family dithiol-disulfide isomerase